MAADFLWPAYDRRYGRRRLIYACGATRTFRDCLNDHFLQRDDFAVTARVLGALFYYSPESHETAPLVQALLTDDWQAQWPLDAEALAPVAAMFKTHSEESLPQAWQRLFIGPYALPSPPWGSVWLDRESVLFGDSTLALRQWMRENGIQFEMQQNEPEDHFGSLLLLAAGLPRMAVIMNANNSAGICFRGRPAFWTYLSIMPGIRFIRRWGNWRV